MSEDTPKISDKEMYQFLREDNVEDFNTHRTEGKPCDMRGLDFRGLDLRGMHVDDIDFTNGYFRGTDIRGLNMSTCNLEGASLRDAKISGTLFPKELSAEEISLSHKLGTRMRYKG